jgi:betaine-homocysteine S-methyltransferase
MANPGLLERLKAGGGSVLQAEGYLFQMEHRGYLKAGAYVPEVVLEHPEVVAQLHEGFRRCGTDVQLAFTYYAHREKLAAIGRDGELENMNRAALALAKKAAEGTDQLVAGNICNTGAYDLENKQASSREVLRQYNEQIGWATEAGVDFIVAETIPYLGEALLAVEAIKSAGQVAVVNLWGNRPDKTYDGVDWVEAAKQLADAGADVVGFNCGRGPAGIMPLMRELRDKVTTPIAAIPVAYRTTPEQPSFQQLKNPDGTSAYTLGLDRYLCTRQEFANFASEAADLGVELLGMCCGGEPYHLRAMAKALGRTTEASKYSPDMAEHYMVGGAGFGKPQEQQFLNHMPEQVVSSK